MSLEKLTDEWLDNKNHMAFLPFRLSLLSYFLVLFMLPSIGLFVACVILSFVLFLYGKHKVKENKKMYLILSQKKE